MFDTLDESLAARIARLVVNNTQAERPISILNLLEDNDTTAIVARNMAKTIEKAHMCRWEDSILNAPEISGALAIIVARNLRTWADIERVEGNDSVFGLGLGKRDEEMNKKHVRLIALMGGRSRSGKIFRAQKSCMDLLRFYPTGLRNIDISNAFIDPSCRCSFAQLLISRREVDSVNVAVSGPEFRRKGEWIAALASHVKSLQTYGPLVLPTKTQLHFPSGFTFPLLLSDPSEPMEPASFFKRRIPPKAGDAKSNCSACGNTFFDTLKHELNTAIARHVLRNSSASERPTAIRQLIKSGRFSMNDARVTMFDTLDESLTANIARLVVNSTQAGERPSAVMKILESGTFKKPKSFFDSLDNGATSIVADYMVKVIQNTHIIHREDILLAILELGGVLADIVWRNLRMRSNTRRLHRDGSAISLWTFDQEPNEKRVRLIALIGARLQTIKFGQTAPRKNFINLLRFHSTGLRNIDISNAYINPSCRCAFGQLLNSRSEIDSVRLQVSEQGFEPETQWIATWASQVKSLHIRTNRCRGEPSTFPTLEKTVFQAVKTHGSRTTKLELDFLPGGVPPGPSTDYAEESVVGQRPSPAMISDVPHEWLAPNILVLAKLEATDPYWPAIICCEEIEAMTEKHKWKKPIDANRNEELYCCVFLNSYFEAWVPRSSILPMNFETLEENRKADKTMLSEEGKLKFAGAFEEGHDRIQEALGGHYCSSGKILATRHSVVEGLAERRFCRMTLAQFAS